MMPMHFPYANNNSAGHYFYGTVVYPNLPVNYNPHVSLFCSNSNGLLPTPPQLLPRSIAAQSKNEPNRQLKRSKQLSPNNATTSVSSLITKKETSVIGSNGLRTFTDPGMKPSSLLNPLANEFSLENINNNDISSVNYKNNLPKRLALDTLIEQSLQSIDVIRKASRGVSVNHIATQCDKSVNQVHCATQTNDANIHDRMLKEYNARTVDLMDTLSEQFKCMLISSDANNLRDKLKSIGYTLDELRFFSLAMNQAITSNNSPLNRDEIFSHMIRDVSVHSLQHMFEVESGSYRSVSSSKNCFSMPLVPSRPIDPSKIIISKICMICQKPIDDTDDVMHELCRLLSSPPDVHNDASV